MTESQFCAWLLFAIPALAFFGNPTMPFKYAIIGAIGYTIIISIPLFFIAEREFIRDCKKGYKEWEDSILPQFLYKQYKGDVE